MKKTITILIPATLLLLVGCVSGKMNKNLSDKTITEENFDENGTTTYTGTYTGYYNSRYGFGTRYPDILIPQGESESGDGQTFVSEDGRSTMRIYRDFRMLTGEPTPIDKAFADDVRQLKPTYKKLHENHYELRGATHTGRQFSRYTLLSRGNEYYTIVLEYDKDDAALFADIMRHVSENLYVMGGEDEFVNLILEFTNECYWNHNVNRMLRDNDKRLTKYIDPQMGIRRYYNPGAFAYLYDRKQNFGFDDYTDFESEPLDGGECSVMELPKDTSPCDLDFNNGKGLPVIYYCEISQVADEVVNPETLEMRPVSLPYPNAKIVALYLPGYYNDNVFPRGFYFVETPKGWKLAFVDDSLCSA